MENRRKKKHFFSPQTRAYVTTTPRARLFARTYPQDVVLHGVKPTSLSFLNLSTTRKQGRNSFTVVVKEYLHTSLLRYLALPRQTRHPTPLVFVSLLWLRVIGQRIILPPPIRLILLLPLVFNGRRHPAVHLESKGVWHPLLTLPFPAATNRGAVAHGKPHAVLLS